MKDTERIEKLEGQVRRLMEAVAELKFQQIAVRTLGLRGNFSMKKVVDEFNEWLDRFKGKP